MTSNSSKSIPRPARCAFQCVLSLRSPRDMSSLSANLVETVEIADPAGKATADLAETVTVDPAETATADLAGMTVAEETTVATDARRMLPHRRLTTTRNL